MTRKKKSKAKWGKIGAPKSQKRKDWLQKLREKKAGGTATEKKKGKKKSKASSSKGVDYHAQW